LPFGLHGQGGALRELGYPLFQKFNRVVSSFSSLLSSAHYALLTMPGQKFKYIVLPQGRQYAGLLYSDSCPSTVNTDRSLSTL
jgi:hypothetical protein